MPSSIQEVDLKEALRNYHRHQGRSGSSSSSSNSNVNIDDAMNTSASEPVLGWDETVADDDCDSSSETDDVQRLHAQSAGSLTPHAMAHRSWIYGIAEKESYDSDYDDDFDMTNDDNPKSPQDWKIRWKTSLAPHRIQQVASNASGTIIAATTDNGTVSIIRGCDGRVLATRRVADAKMDEDFTVNSAAMVGMTPQLSFVTQKTDSTMSNPRDALLVQTPDQPALLVSNIQGERLNDENDTVVTQATKSMNLQVVQIPSIDPSDVQCMCGYFYSSEKNIDDSKEGSADYCDRIRLVLIHNDLSGEARLAVAEYDLGSEVCRLLQKNISVANGVEWEIDTLIGLRLTSFLDRYILALVAHPTPRQNIEQHKTLRQQKSSSSKILWLDPDHDLVSNQMDIATIRGEYPLVTALKENGVAEEHYKRYQRSRVQALEFVHSFDSQEAMAMVIAMGEIGGQKSAEMQIMQAQVKNDNSGRMLRFGHAHMLYQIQMPSTMATAKSISFCPLDPEVFGPYSFRSKSSLGWNHHGQIHTFQTKRVGESSSDCSAIGAIRLLITKNEFNKARALVHEVGMEVLLEDEAAHFHPSEIVLQRLRQSLSISLESNGSDNDWNESLIGLGRGAGNSKGQRVFLEAADYVLNWQPKTEVSNFGLELIVGRLTSFLETMRNVSDEFLDQDVPAWITATYNNRVHALQEKHTALSYMNSLLKNSKSKIEAGAQYSSVGSIDDLFFCFVQSSNFAAAEKLWSSTMRPKLTPSVMVSAILQIPSTIHPQKYTNLLEYIVLPSLSINHEQLSSILTWSCKLADKFDAANENGLEWSIFLLETIVRATKRLRLKIHSSFAHYSPFVDTMTNGNPKGRLKPIKERNTNNVSMSGIFSLDSSFGGENRSLLPQSSDDSLSIDGRRKKKPRIALDDKQPNPTILELGRMKRGATRSGQIQSLSVDAIDENEENVETKLETARWLKLARSLGLSRDILHLDNFVDEGGARFASKELIRYYSSSALSHEERYGDLTKKVENFCTISRSGYDEALIEYSKELCRGRNTSTQSIEEVASIARCCICPTSKCQITKIALQAALFCRFSPAWLTQLSKEAIEWSAGDSSLRSELEEASRLLLIDGIVGRYCGNGAKELFHIDNPHHATRLLDFMSKHLDQATVLEDIIDLCKAFSHLSIEDGCSRLVQNAMLRGQEEMAINILQSLYDRNSTSAHNVFSRVVSFCIDVIGDNASRIGPFLDTDGDLESTMCLKESKIISSCAYELTKIALVHSRMIVRGRFGSGFTTWQYDEVRLQILLSDLQRLIALQQDHEIFVALADLNEPKVMVGIASKLLNNLADMYLKGEVNAASMIATQTKKACSLLSRAPHLTESDLLFTSAAPIACQLALRTNDFEAFDFLADLRILEASQCNTAARCCIAVSLAYCKKLSKSKSPLFDTMKSLVMASSLLQDYILSQCPQEILGAATDFSQLCDIVSQVLARADEGFGEKLDEFRKMLLERAAEKRWSFALSNSSRRNDLGESVRISQPTLHPSWYVGDGLLLPPEEALMKGIDYCKQAMGLQMMDDPSMGIHAFVANRGAHALALRILSHSTTTQICLRKNGLFFDELREFNQHINIGLVERYLGGTGNGITSGVVDSQLAASFLLSLPLKLAFKIYRSSLPTAINTRDFKRVVILATIGKVSGSKDSIMSPTGARLGNWTKQRKFVSQCDHLATRASWWNVLEENKINFNPHSFDDESSIERMEDSYVASIIPDLICNMMSRKEGQIDYTLAVATKFASTFSIPSDLPACRFIQYLLSPTKSDGGHHVREKVSSLNETVRKLLQSLSCSEKRVNVLRRCLIQFESHDTCFDYERLSIVYSLYQSELSDILSKDFKEENDAMNNLYVEMELIDRRRDALAILSSYFQGDKKDERPSFSKFFASLNESIDDNTNANIKSKKYCSRVLGWEAPLEKDTVDPLDPLEQILRSSCSSAVTSALSPICIPLCVPRGYVKVRSLITRFQKSCDEGAALPTFEDDVLPILNLLRAPSDVAELAEWCSKQYGLNAPDKLICLDHALNYAIKASTEAESDADQRKEEFDSKSLARVKRITVSKDLLEDRLEITKILQPQITERKNQGSVSNVLVKLMKKLEAEVWSKATTFVPERFVDALFTEASLLVAEATLSEGQSLSIGQFRQLSHLIHRVCNCISRKYSHVQSGYLARRLTKRWLLYGDEQSNETEGEKDKGMIPVISQVDNLFPDIDEDDTMNFQMDLSILKEDSSNFSMVAFNSISEKKRLTSEEEPSSLEATSGREVSELASHRSALRIAFVMAFADGYHQSLAGGSNEENDENLKKDFNRKPNSSKTPRRGLLSKMKKNKVNNQADQHISVLQHARDLIRIVFAKSTSADRVMMGLNSSFYSMGIPETNRNKSATITFAMRHRCLRVASILVPQEALEEVLNEDESNPNISLKECTFGSFCAKELEEMGLPIPHSDLFQLSQMHFPSYARALWRHHRDLKGAKGRFLLLILELYLKEQISDNGFFLSIIKEIEALNIPRSLLLGCECIIRYMGKIGPENALKFLESNKMDVSRITGKLLQMVYADLKRNIEKFESDEIGDATCEERRSMMITLSRLSRIVGAFSETSEGQRLLVDFCQELIKDFSSLTKNSDERQYLRSALEYAIFRTQAEDVQDNLLARLSKFSGSSTEVEKVNEHGDPLISPTQPWAALK